MREETKRQIFSLMCKGDYLCSFASGLWLFVVVCGRLWWFPGGLWSFVVVACFSLNI